MANYYSEYRAYQWNIQDIGEGYTAQDIAQLQALIDEEIARMPYAHWSVEVVDNATRDNRINGIESCDERESLATARAYALFIGEPLEAMRVDGQITAWEDENADFLTNDDPGAPLDGEDDEDDDA